MTQLGCHLARPAGMFVPLRHPGQGCFSARCNRVLCWNSQRAPGSCCPKPLRSKSHVMAAAQQEGGGVEQVVLAPVASPEELLQEAAWLADMITVWLDEEWLPQDVHRQLGNEAGAAYGRIRKAGEAELGSILLDMSTELMSFDFHNTFTNAFEVSNKVAELLMLNMGREVCCQSEADKDRVARYGLPGEGLDR